MLHHQVVFDDLDCPLYEHSYERRKNLPSKDLIYLVIELVVRAAAMKSLIGT